VAVVDEAGEELETVRRGFLLDITERKLAELGRAQAEVELRSQAELNRHQALHDPLTDLPNRTLFRDRVEQEIHNGRLRGQGGAVILIDLDRFKEVNDTLGHQSGDALLLGLAKRLRGSVRAGDTVARLGGDEFGLLAPGVRSDVDALALAAAIHAALASPVPVGDLELEVSASAGIALFPRDGDDVETLIRHADVALYRSKESHASTVYSPDHDHYSPTRLKLLTGLRRAIANGELVVNYQPQVSATTGAIASVEALVRWEHPELGLVMPDQFIPLAEHTDLIRPLTLHVLDTAVAQCRDWSARGWDVGVAVNVTGRDLLNATFADEVAACLERHGVDPGRLELEITENTIFSDPQRALAVLTRLGACGVRLAIDDFGAGNSSLGYLSRLPVHVLKIDKSFVLEMEEGNSASTIVQSTIELGHNLGLEVVAEGVETEERRRTLVDLRCDVTQGFLHGRAVSAGDVEKLFSSPVIARDKLQASLAR
jgi:diguanylate cyclase (GGDEF)-like protein